MKNALAGVVTLFVAAGLTASCSSSSAPASTSGDDAGGRDGSTSKDGSGTGSGEDVDVGTGATCTWPASFDPSAGSDTFGTGVCSAHHYFFSCTGSNGGGICTGNDAAAPQCPELGSGYACTSKCGASEYAMLCQAVNAPAPSPSCHIVTQSYGPEQTFFCCSCSGEGS